ncbi:MAG TPA: AAA family ATPase [Steroidobacteraceae bacterium]|nr:AAA family ATPase [Steroidobacteraceae bacterium]
MTREQFEKQLLSDPFDLGLRLRYGDLLLSESDFDAALAQFDLVCKQQPTSALAHVGAARALLSMENRTEATARYTRARNLDGFASDEALEQLEKQARRTGPSLRIVGTPTATVTPIQRVTEEKVRFSSIVGMEDLKKSIRLKIIEPFINPGIFRKFKKQAGGGIMLYGPPGCGKTMIARAIANECNASFMSIGIADVLNMWIGESERNLAAIFAKARSQAPCVMFFDEIDALAYARSKANSEHTRTVVNEFLTQLDGVGKDNQGVLILAATNMPWDVDSAIKRPGRLSRQLFVPPPDVEARARMLDIKLTGVPCDAIDTMRVGQRTENFSGADIDGLIELAKEKALEDHLVNKIERPLRQSDFDEALTEMQPSTLDWLRTARNLVKYAGDDGSYRDVEAYLKKNKMF